MKTLLKRLFWASGRVGRLDFILVAVIAWNIFGCWIAMSVAWASETGADSEKIAEWMQFLATPFARIWGIGVVAALWVSIANNFKRLHDLGWSGLWQFVPPIAICGWAKFVLSIDGQAGQFHDYHPAYLFAILAVGIGAWIAITSGCFALLGFMLFRRGQDGDNSYGPTPHWPFANSPAMGREAAEEAAAP